ncbi:cytochrome c oxidase assembly factor CtaG [Oceanobacillus bengalensis]|uniref:Cytochrome c oxidase assembly factor CtaG n=1 Tax=Oceanobacillus bengalensis TaxID=1435466 RepID=A0A494Z1R6_9BACI|nr:cytochrome c oxidase assembly factor CtaG [Oceanobacillus bengalensis]RKQ16333.1 cytochrome c oxidase assembly factor CtaG [Oceanobacillus bengalensis]
MWLELQIFGFRAMWSPYYLIFLGLMAVVYSLITGRYRHHFGENEKPSVKQQFYFYLGLILIYFSKGSPVDLLSHIMLTAHMTQMAIYLIIAPILIIKGLPVWIWRRIFNTPVIKTILNTLTRPLISLLFFNGLFSVYHLPVVFNFSKSSPVAHTAIHLLLLFAAFIMWLPLLTPVKEMDKLSPILKMGYIFVNSVLITPACVLIIFASAPLYAAYTQDGAWLTALSLCVPSDVMSGLSSMLTGPELFSPLSVMLDQQVGGIIMKVVQELTYGAVLASILFQWFRGEGSKIDPLPSTPIESH